MARGGRPSARARTSAALVGTSPHFGSLGTSTANSGTDVERSSRASIASLSARRTSASTCRFKPDPAAPKTARGRAGGDTRDRHAKRCRRPRTRGQPGFHERRRRGASGGARGPGRRRGRSRGASAAPHARGGSARSPHRRRDSEAERLPPPPTGRSPRRGPPPAWLARLLRLATIPPALRLLLARLFLLGPDALDELDQRQRRRVTAAHAELHDPRVAAGAAVEARRELVEQLLQNAPPAEERRRAPPRG